MDLFIDNKSGAPIYDQIYAQIKDQIIQGALQPDEAMPSIRGLARDLRISVITTKRAYDELEKEGFLYAVPAKGFFVAPKNTELLREENLKKIEAHLTEAVRLSASCGLSREELREMLELLWEPENIVYINVANNISIDCDCDNNPKDPEIADIGIFASLDPVALDKCCYDTIMNLTENGANALRMRMLDKNAIHIVEEAQRLGLGTTLYELVSID